ncbi:T9SS type A sorting domain-containing protein [Dinghuibacter silviterrae]|uniref:Putative secreted protein (Por secretion system target) n=1 Tax=Dinghuibacter silviterrae TaxID=1539049 RepID=A0A4R8DIE1_9BACT|nr:T9SS type A sorting domain-containing protein [Dinghuibacter silviterrae]TDW97509.1 putative secreted protein (Por secretion system target) [Dinghuibacter silviterrae]
MKRLCLANLSIAGVVLPIALTAQCTGTCPSGALTTLPSGTSVTIPAGTTYCVSGSVVNKTTSYVINGTLIVQGGPDTIGSVTLSRTGVIDVQTGGHLVVSGTFTGDPTTPAPAITNVNVCNEGVLNITGAFQQQEINMAIASGGVLLVQGSWSTNASDVTIDIGPSALIEICGVVTVSKNGFLTETGTGTSYLFQHTGGTYNGWISTAQNASNIDWTSVAPSAFATHPAARTCNGCGNLTLAPPGADNNCGDAAATYANIILPLQVINFYESMQGDTLLITTDVATGSRWTATALMASPDGRSFAKTAYAAVESVSAGLVHFTYSLPFKQADQYFQWKAWTAGDSIQSWVLPPLLTGASGLRVYPNPASTVLYLRIPQDKAFTTATLTDNTGRLVRQITIPAQGGLISIDLPAGLSQGLYFITFRGDRAQPVALKVFIKQR